MASTQNISPHCVSFSPKPLRVTAWPALKTLARIVLVFHPKPLRVTAWPALKTLGRIVLVFHQNL